MAYYAAFNSLVQLFEEISHPGIHPHKQQIAFLHEKWSHLQELLGDYYSPRSDKEAADDLERRIRDAAYRAQYIIQYRVSHSIPSVQTVGKLLQQLEAMKEEIDSIVEKVMRIKDGDADQEEDLQVNSFVSVDSSGSIKSSSTEW